MNPGAAKQRVLARYPNAYAYKCPLSGLWSACTTFPNHRRFVSEGETEEAAWAALAEVIEGKKKPAEEPVKLGGG